MGAAKPLGWCIERRTQPVWVMLLRVVNLVAVNVWTLSLDTVFQFKFYRSFLCKVSCSEI